MTAYAIFIREKTRDPAEMLNYAALAAPLLAKSQATVLAAYGPQDVLEGAAPEGVVVVTFPTMEAARAFYDGAEYRAAVRHRFLGADYRSFILQGVDP
ncbi:DUF1330 domain-containing protein [Rhizobium leguminosarum]|uniref:DUF1330 domain-containing protein n=1 Tax=Rhizobium leguminosarum TaxID=384 RepID=UPI00047F1856|nr:DUF1330 domain-containing protein [Rhizobium leguminosarum]